MRKRGLTQEQIDLRDGRLTASRVHCLMTGDEDEINALWEEMVGTKEPDDLSDDWAAQLGLQTEELNLDWYEKKTGNEVIRRGEVVHKDDWAAATLDGWDVIDGMVVEAKHVGGFEPPETILARYQPQLHWTMFVTGTKRIALSVIYGAKEPVVDIIEWDADYGALLIERAEAFMTYVMSFTRPFKKFEPVASPTIPDRTVNMAETSQANQWADLAATWLENVDAGKKADAAEKELKGLVPADAKVATGFGVIIKRSRAGSLSLRKEEKSK